MSLKNASEAVLSDESRYARNAVADSPDAKKAREQFEAENKLRRALIAARKEQNITQVDLKEMTGMTQQVISRIESSKEISPSLKNIIRYVNAIGYELTLRQKHE